MFKFLSEVILIITSNSLIDKTILKVNKQFPKLCSKHSDIVPELLRAAKWVHIRFAIGHNTERD